MKLNSTLVCIILCLLTACSQKSQKMKPTAQENLQDTTIHKTTYTQQKLITMQQDGIDFYAAGENDAWILTMDFDNEFYFKTTNGIAYKAPAVIPILAQDHPVKRYRTVTEEGELIVQIIPSACVNETTKLESNYTVRINYKAASAKDYTNFNACGNYIPDYRLHDIWAIVQVDSLKIDPTDFRKNKPVVEIDMTAKRIMGADGCNTFRGSFYNEGNRLFVGPLASTMMACIKNEAITQKINSILSLKNLEYTLQNNELQLYTNNKKRMTLKHID
ncbi:META domain-containing protein [Lutibacter holmesii]|uniref:META domain-containing protein n=1 Tax=Lutibacter holmesii TaxID=1137985 RepID=A0ABW3WRI8_9FLAO